MAAYEIPNLRFSLEAAGPVARRRFVVVDANGKGAQAGAGELAIGVSMNDPAAGEVLEVADGIVMVEAGAAIVAGSEVQSGTDGKAVPLATVEVTASGDAETLVIPRSAKLGIALTGGAAEQLIAVKMY